MAEAIRCIQTSDAPASAGHYSQAVVHAGTVYVSGLLPIDPKTGEKKLGPMEEQVEQVLRNLEAILRASGSGLSRVLKVTIYVSDIEAWPQVNAVYTRHFGAHKPARAVIPVGPLHYGCKVELEAIAAVDY